MDKNDLTTYVKYLEDRVKQLSENTTLGDADFDALLDVQNEIAINASGNFKQIFLENSHLKAQLEQLQQKSAMSDIFIEYLTNSIWWKATAPFRTISRRLRNRRPYTPFDFSNPTPIKEKVHAFIYASALADALDKQLDCLSRQHDLENLNFTILSLDNSPVVAKVAKNHKIPCYNLLATGDDLILNKTLSNDAKYLVYIGQNVLVKDSSFLYKMLRPLVADYTPLSVLYDPKFSSIEDLKNNTPYNELRARIFPIEHYECLLMPSNRDGVQFIPTQILDQISALAKLNPCIR